MPVYTLHEDMYEWIYMSVVNTLSDAIDQQEIPIRLIGTPETELEEYEDWIDFHMLEVEKVLARTNSYESDIALQFTAHSKFAHLRKDKKATAPFNIAGKLLTLLENKCIVVRQWGQSASPPAQAGVLRVFEGQQKHINQKTVGGIQNTGVSNPYSNVHSVIVLFMAKMEAL